MKETKHKFIELTKEKKVNLFEIELFRIKCTKTFINKLAGEIKEGELGGWVADLEDFKNPYSGDYGDAWVSGDAEVYGNAKVYGDAWVSRDARVYGDAEVSGNARVYGKCKISFILCPRFNFEFQWQINAWLKLEKEFKLKLEELSE